MKKQFIFFFLTICTMVQAQTNVVQLIPKPVELQLATGVFTLTNDTTVSYDKPESEAIANILTQRLNTPTGFSLKAQQGKMGIIRLNINAQPNAELGTEGYTLDATPQGVTIAANQTAGLYYGEIGRAHV